MNSSSIQLLVLWYSEEYKVQAIRPITSLVGGLKADRAYVVSAPRAAFRSLRSKLDLAFSELLALPETFSIYDEQGKRLYARALSHTSHNPHTSKLVGGSALYLDINVQRQCLDRNTTRSG